MATYDKKMQNTNEKRSVQVPEFRIHPFQHQCGWYQQTLNNGRQQKHCQWNANQSIYHAKHLSRG